MYLQLNKYSLVPNCFYEPIPCKTGFLFVFNAFCFQILARI
jgi:hypothetical protein